MWFFNKKYPIKLYQKLGFYWLILYTLGSVSFTLFVHQNYYTGIFIFIPFVHCILFTILLFRFRYKNKNGEENRAGKLYMQKEYPDIFERLHPNGLPSRNIFAYFNFIQHKYDDRSDERLNAIKADIDRLYLLILWAFLLIYLNTMIGVWGGLLQM